MKVGILINSIEYFGGIGRIAVEEVKNLRQLGVNAELLVFSDFGNENKFKDISADIPIIRLAARLPRVLRIKIKVPFFTIFSFSHLLYPLILPKYIKDNEWDIIINHESYLTFFLLRLKNRKRTKYIQFVWDPVSYICKRVYNKGFLRLFNKLLYRMALKLDYLFIKNAEMVLIGGDAHEEFIKSVTKDYQIIYPSVYLRETVNYDKEDFIFMITAWNEGKNPEYVLDILKKMPELRIKMGGIWLDKEYMQRFCGLVRKEGLCSRLEILGSLREKELNDYLSRARLLLQTNDDRGFGMPALEAAACGCSFIIPDGQGVCCLFKNEEDGFFVKEHDTERIISLLSTFLSNKDLAYKMGRNAWEKIVKNNCSWQGHAEKIIKVIEDKTKIRCQKA